MRIDGFDGTMRSPPGRATTQVRVDSQGVVRGFREVRERGTIDRNRIGILPRDVRVEVSNNPVLCRRSIVS